MNACLLANQLSQVTCNYQEVNYTINVATRETGYNIISFGPYQHYGSGTVTQTVSSTLLKLDSEHSLVVVLNTITGSASSNEYYFGKIHAHYAIEFKTHLKCS